MGIIPAYPRFTRMYGVTNSFAFQASLNLQNLNNLTFQRKCAPLVLELTIISNLRNLIPIFSIFIFLSRISNSLILDYKNNSAHYI